MAIQFGIIAVLFLSVYAFTNPQVDFTRNTETGIQFQNEKWITALQRAKKENKLIFLDVYAVWCGPCKRLKKNTFSNAEVGQVFNHKFINLAMDGEKGEGPDLMEQYRLTSFPSLLFILIASSQLDQHNFFFLELLLQYLNFSHQLLYSH